MLGEEVAEDGDEREFLAPLIAADVGLDTRDRQATLLSSRHRLGTGGRVLRRALDQRRARGAIDRLREEAF